jgi:hypothetical protein
LLSTNLPLFAGGRQLLVPFRLDLVTPGEHVLGCDVPDGAAQTNIVAASPFPAEPEQIEYPVNHQLSLGLDWPLGWEDGKHNKRRA